MHHTPTDTLIQSVAAALVPCRQYCWDGAGAIGLVALRLCMRRGLFMQDGGAGVFRRRADRLEKELAEAEREAGGNKEELELFMRRAEAEFERNDTSVYKIRTMVRICERAIDDRWQNYAVMFESERKTVSLKFLRYMYRRGHLGHLRVDQDRGELKLLVEINAKAQGAGAKKSKAVKDLKQLSGERAESPFRAMDEYDVFMDAITRRIATQTLLQNAMEQDGMQLLLLTPQDLAVFEDAKQQLAKNRGHVIPESFVTVIKMREPRDGTQRRVTFADINYFGEDGQQRE